MPIRLKRVYEERAAEDGFRILVDRIWPRGVSKLDAAVDQWFKDAAPSPQLRRWFGHDPERWAEFQRRYRDELSANRAAVDELRHRIKDEKNVTLVYAARDSEHNHAIVLRDVLES